jgi:aubergine
LNREKALPDTIIVYREGLSDMQIKKSIREELESLYFIINLIRKRKEFANYSPEIVFFIVNKKVNSKFYDFDQKNAHDFRNPSTGSVIFNQMASAGQIDFYLVPQKVDECMGAAIPSQYKLVYYKPAGEPEESASREVSTQEESKSMTKQDLPLFALAQLTYEQCFNYYNWIGAIRIPSVLQCGDKLSTMVGEHIRSNVNEIDYHNEANKLLSSRKEEERGALKEKMASEWRNVLSSQWFQTRMNHFPLCLANRK